MHLPDRPNQVAMMAQMQNALGAAEASGQSFDIAYISAQIQDHQRTANLLQWHISTGQNEALRKYSMETLPEVMDLSNTRNRTSPW